ncbi:hypothetical protein GCM10010112_64720 [Actinoplanes lobatus]|uniref:Uncharacterized protein n=1 Tax=Actinoplanes lobatus TaxID=113568 RepID=A0A7W7HN45_9ACTN|nr:hypothetical protein [Actinoplanes lobatus]MBB4753536.1 hypothetical protein [Actinoplanes lobatus]GGN84924.1 hypothetical protein GCM10010112_64720 [Actinoplanes lobatus]GIE38071.1 hypothetical protein Alo02nite_09690 [Actinoplanes lobatus]
MIKFRVRSYQDRMAGYRRVLEARSPETTLERLRELAGDEIRPVRLWTARNPRTPADALARLLGDADESVQWNALLHTGTPGTALEWLADEEEARYGVRHFLCRSLIVHHPNTPDALRRRLLRAGACGCPKWCGGRIPFRRLT